MSALTLSAADRERVQCRVRILGIVWTAVAVVFVATVLPRLFWSLLRTTSEEVDGQ